MARTRPCSSSLRPWHGTSGLDDRHPGAPRGGLWSSASSTTGSVCGSRNPRTHDRLRGFVESMDRLREEPDGDDDLLLDRPVGALRPARTLGRLVVQKGSVTPVALPDRAVPVGAGLMADTVHHVALMRNAELVVKYLPAGAAPVVARMGYAGVFKCAVDVDYAFRAAEPPTHDNWVPRSVPAGHDRRFVDNRARADCASDHSRSSRLRRIDELGGFGLGDPARRIRGQPGILDARPRRARCASGCTRANDRFVATPLPGHLLQSKGCARDLGRREHHRQSGSMAQARMAWIQPPHCGRTPSIRPRSDHPKYGLLESLNPQLHPTGARSFDTRSRSALAETP